MTIIYEIDTINWYIDRKLPFTPRHFIKVKTKLTDENELWILKNLKGRYGLVIETDNYDSYTVPAFEDPAEAVIYELTWS